MKTKIGEKKACEDNPIKNAFNIFLVIFVPFFF